MYLNTAQLCAHWKVKTIPKYKPWKLSKIDSISPAMHEWIMRGLAFLCAIISVITIYTTNMYSTGRVTLFFFNNS